MLRTQNRERDAESHCNLGLKEWWFRLPDNIEGIFIEIRDFCSDFYNCHELGDLGLVVTSKQTSRGEKGEF